MTSKSIDELRAGLSDKLEELHRRANRATQVLAPSTYWNDPVVRFGIGVAVGLAIGMRGERKDGEGGLLYSMMRAGLSAAASALISKAITAPAALAAPADPALAPSDGPPRSPR